MKTPEEIKKGLECYAGFVSCERYDRCIECPNYVYTPTEMVCQQPIIDVITYTQQLEQRVPRWISVEERLPEEMKYVLVSAPYEDNELQQVAFLFKERWYVYAAGEIAPTVTHWMPLPEPPDNEKKGDN